MQTSWRKGGLWGIFEIRFTLAGNLRRKVIVPKLGHDDDAVPLPLLTLKFL